MASIAELLDKAEITSQMANYCRAVDRMDRDLLLSAFHPNAVMEYTDRIANASVSEFVWEFHGTLERHSHQITNSIIRLFGDAGRVLERSVQHRWGEARHIADAVLFLGSRRAEFITGVTLPVDGGYTAD